METNRWIGYTSIACLLGVGFSCTDKPENTMVGIQKPNILFILCDDMGYGDLACYGQKYINTPFKIYFEDIGLRNAKLNFRQMEQTHIMENIIYNELRYRGYNVDVGMVESYENDKDGNRVKRQREIDFVANLGSKRYYIQSSYEIFSEGKFAQETKPFDKINDSFKKVIIVYQNIKPRRSEKGYLVIGLKDFLLNENSLDQ